MGGEFLVGKDDEFGEGGFEEPFESEAEFGGGEDDGDEALVAHFGHSLGEFAEEVLGGLGIDDEADIEGGSLDFGHEELFEAWVEGDGLEEAWLAFEFADEVEAEAFTDLFGEVIGIFGDGGKVGDAFHDHGEVFDGDAFAEEVLEDPLNDPDIDEVGDEFVDQGGV